MSDKRILENGSCESIGNFKTNIYVPTYITVFILGFIENVFCLYVFLKLYKKKNAFSIVMVNLAMSDLLFVCTLPWRAYYYWKHNWTFPNCLCVILIYALYFNMYSSIYFLTLMSILRYVAVVHPVKGLKYRNVKYVQIICIAIWVFVGVASIPLLVIGNKEEQCFELSNGIDVMDIKIIFTMDLISLVLGFIIPFFFFTICYILVVKALLTSKTNPHKQHSSRRKAIARIVVVMVIFITGFPIYHIVRTIYLTEISTRRNVSHVSCLLQKSAVATLSHAVMNPCLDPLLYYFAAQTFRDKVRNTIKNAFKGCPAPMQQT
ncbi:cysteinyl leukotriene receptor 2-like [Scyliorhinus canicula]|uniref:cysteinyl leukotriene receptor 2-like n=1 Tax=Scyliorhinus canicula TaxID=7830 RepID=UPI0018F30C13|nr:cysteinyl leukotriene receptor 2-like [Scyliorhinus canicula]XP_038657177.1 cysteinyl leukotriene receptor 2-like [Scyliorhinus canicula]